MQPKKVPIICTWINPCRLFRASVFRNWASLWENQSSGFPTRSYTNRAVQPQKMARGLKFCIKEVEGLYYPCSENKGADQLRGYQEADLRLCFRICKTLVFSWRGSNAKQYWFIMGLLVWCQRSLQINSVISFCLCRIRKKMWWALTAERAGMCALGLPVLRWFTGGSPVFSVPKYRLSFEWVK